MTLSGQPCVSLFPVAVPGAPRSLVHRLRRIHLGSSAGVREESQATDEGSRQKPRALAVSLTSSQHSCCSPTCTASSETRGGFLGVCVAKQPAPSVSYHWLRFRLSQSAKSVTMSFCCPASGTLSLLFHLHFLSLGNPPADGFPLLLASLNLPSQPELALARLPALTSAQCSLLWAGAHSRAQSHSAALWACPPPPPHKSLPLLGARQYPSAETLLVHLRDYSQQPWGVPTLRTLMTCPRAHRQVEMLLGLTLAIKWRGSLTD